MESLDSRAASGSSATWFNSLPAGVTLLELSDFGNALYRQHTSLAPLPLQHVQLRNMLVGDSLCTHMSGLTNLVVGFVQGAAFLDGYYTATPAQPFTDMLHHAVQLQHLQLMQSIDGRPLSRADCCAFVHATQLTHLSFCNTQFEARAVTGMFGAAVAAAAPAFACLQELSFDGCLEWGQMHDYVSPPVGDSPRSSRMASGKFFDITYQLFKAVLCSSLSLLTGSCPHLRRLSIVDSLWQHCSAAVAAQSQQLVH
jgi:hypothetical protein